MVAQVKLNSKIWSDIITAVENKTSKPMQFERFFIGRIDLVPHAPIHNRKSTISVIKTTKKHFILGKPLSGIALTPREVEVLRFICTGDTNIEVAQKLKLSARTIEYYIKNMRKKIEANSKAELIRLVLQTNFLLASAS